MNVHLSAHFPLIQVVVAIIGLVILSIVTKQAAWAELGKALLWAGSFAALFAAAGSC